MVKYLVGLVVGVVGLYAAQRLWSAPIDDGPDFKVWVEQTHIPPNNDPYDVLYLQSREDRPITVKGVVMNDDPKCVNMDLSTHKTDVPMKLGEVSRFALGIHGFNACQPVRVVVTTDRGEAYFQMND
jgi:hypothetical protein